MSYATQTTTGNRSAVRALGAGGRLLGVHSHGGDPGLEIIREIWPDENPFTTSRHDLLRALRAGSAA